MSTYSNAPNSPLHPEPDSEISELPKETDFDEQELDFLDLNPDLNQREQFKQSISIDSNQLKSELPEDYKPILTPSPAPPNVIPYRKLSNTQQLKFMNYADERLMYIQRRFIQSFGLNQGIGYISLSELLQDDKNLINFIWMSINSTDLALLKNSLFGQTDYLIRIANDLLEYLDKMIVTIENSKEILKLISSLNDKFSYLIDGKGYSQTEMVRINGIAERTRLLIVEVFDKFGIEGYQYEISKIYEDVLDRTG
ncbi:hypothetical protein WICMUC_001893 [Wickerhamomyces mucosus]|uniref:Uncharacterized protein n=1 Tax=Wickerhamomyces mucosus TaxID=1378264 RepID=A0A9P8PRS9_9ASCO|nr:hypothetical protein WICMUC_001893 [Wickerhamomyces mucosus]